jgi:branched-chain amino acid aminotransferase
LGVKASDTYKFMILLSPTGPYYSTPLRIYVEEKYTRAARGGFGFAKAAGNYGGSMLATAIAKKRGFDQVLWMDAFEHKYIQEMGTMNVFFVIGDKVLTPDLEDGTILEGVTRDSAIEVLREEGYTVEEGPIHIDDVVRAYQAGELKEAFGTGTAATISMIKELCYEDVTIKFDIEAAKVAPTVKRVLTDIREGRRKDTRGWMFKI